MIENSIARRYARSLIAVAKGKNAPSSEHGEREGEAQRAVPGEGATPAPLIDDFAAQLGALSAAFAVSPQALEVLANAAFDVQAREHAAEALAAKTGAAKEVQNFLKLLIRKGRMGLFALIHDEYTALANQLQNRSVMTVESAVELKATRYNELTQSFARKTGKQIILCKKITPEILGGVRVRIAGKIYDYTLQSQLESLKQQMMS